MIPIVVNKEKENIAIIIMIAIMLVGLSNIIACSAILQSPTETVALLETVKIKLNPTPEGIVVNNMTWNDFKLWMFNNDSTVYNCYNDTFYDCNNFSNDLRNNAQADGIIIYGAFIRESDDKNHCLNYGCFKNDITGEPSYALIEPQEGKVFFEIEDYVHSKEEWDIISIIIKEGTFGENERSIKRIY